MEKFILSADSSSDLLYDFYTENNIHFIPLSLTKEKNGIISNLYDSFKSEAEYLDFYNEIRSGANFKTSQISEYTHYEYLKKLLQENEGDLIHFCLSSGLSGTYDCGFKAGETLKKEFPDRNIFIVDSLSATIGHTILVQKALELLKEKDTVKEVFDIIEQEKNNLHHWLLVSDLFHLRKGGRLNVLQAVVGTAFNLHPIIDVNTEGRLAVYEKAKGFKKAIKAVASKIDEFCIDPENQVFAITHTDWQEGITALQEEILKKYPNAKFQVQLMGATIGTHVGPNSLGLGFFGKERIPAKK